MGTSHVASTLDAVDVRHPGRSWRRPGSLALIGALVAVLVGVPATPAFAAAMTGAATGLADADTIVVAFDGTPDCGNLGSWAATQFSYDADNDTNTANVTASSLACANGMLSVTFADATVGSVDDTDDVLRYAESVTVSERVTLDAGTELDDGAVAIADGTGPQIWSVTLSNDGNGNQVWDAVGDVLTVVWSSNATLASGILADNGFTSAEDAGFEGVLGTQADLGSALVRVLGSASQQWTLTVETASLTEGIAVGDATNGTENANVTTGSDDQVPGSMVTVQAGNWPVCGTTVGSVTVNTRCITAFSTATDGSLLSTATDNNDLDLQVFDTGLLQIQVINADLLGSPTGAQYELVGSGHLLAANEQVTIGLNVGTLDPTVLIGTADLSSYTVTAGASNTVQIVGTPQAASYTWAITCEVGNCGNDSTQATVNYTGTLTYALDALAAASVADRAAMDGAWIMTDAQAFGAPTWNPVSQSFDIAVAAPHFLAGGGNIVNEGFFRAFIPVGMFGANYFNVDPNNAVYTATADGDGATVSSSIVTSGSTVVGVQLDVTGFHYSSPTIKLKAAAAPSSTPAPSPGTGTGTGTTTPPAPTPPPFDEPVEDEVDEGEKVTTDPTGVGATPERPTQTAIISPVPGTVRIEQKTTTTTPLPSGQTALDVQVDIEAPAATPDEPLVLDFEIDASLLDDVDLDRLVVYRNGVPVAACISASRAVPDPCLATSRTQGDGDLTLTVRTSRASSWNFGVVEEACPDGLVPAAGFTDVPAGAAHGPRIDCAAWWGAVEGRGGTYSPAARLTRGQAASIIRRIIDASQARLPAPGDRFDDEGADHGDAIERLAAAGIINGVDGRTFAPKAPITRAQMAKLLVEAYEYASRERIGASRDAFRDDDGAALEDWIDRAAAVGLVRGRTETTFAPNDRVTRAQTASFAVHLLEALVAGDHADPPVR